MCNHFAYFLHLMDIIAVYMVRGDGEIVMSLHSKEQFGVRYTRFGPQWTVIRRKICLNTTVHISGERGMKSARRTHDQYHSPMDFYQDLQG